MVLYNPTSTQVHTVISGRKYIVGPLDTVTVPDTDGYSWLKIHAFLEMVPEKKAKVEEEIEKPKKSKKE